jgi:ABC-2 type transport system permease protein
MGLIVLVIMFSGMLSSELSRGTLTIMLSKGLSRSAVILSKLTSAVLIWTASFTLSVLTAWGYTAYMFEERVSNLFFAMFCMWVFGVFLLALTTLMAALVSKGYACMLSVGGIAVLLTLLDFIPKADTYNPMSLSTSTLLLLIDEVTPRAFFPALAAAGTGIAAFTLFAVIKFSKKKAVKKTALIAAGTALCMVLTIFLGERMTIA